MLTRSIKKKNYWLILLIIIITLCGHYPEVFFNKSFLGLHAGVSQFSETLLLPGQPQNEKPMQYRRSDIGATYWSLAPNSYVANESIFKFKELPWINPYIAAGSEIFSQGNNLIGDPLHLFSVVLFKSSALSWDIKFILSKIIFSVGLFFLLLKIKKDHTASFLISSAVLFIGLFNFRFNHPAFFTLTYLPLIILSFKYILEIYRYNVIQKFIIIISITFLFWSFLNSAGVKEIFGASLFVFLFCSYDFFSSRHSLRNTISPYYLFLLIIGLLCATSIYWLNFLELLSQSFTTYDSGGTNYYHPLSLIGVFDHNFSWYSIRILRPSLNLFFLYFFIFFIVNFRAVESHLKYFIVILFLVFYSLTHLSFFSFFLDKIPFVNKIIHSNDVLSYPLLMAIIFGAFFGLINFLNTNVKKINLFNIFFLKIYFFLFLPNLILEYVNEGRGNSVFYFLIYLLVFFLYSKIFSVLNLKNQHDIVKISKKNIFLIFSLLIITSIPHAHHLRSSFKTIDSLFFVPNTRSNYDTPSDSINYIREQLSSNNYLKVIGVDDVFFPGYNSRHSIESLISVEPLRNRYYENLLISLGFVLANPEKPRSWYRNLPSTKVASMEKQLRFLGFDYLVSDKKYLHSMKNFPLVYEGDLNVYKVNNSWPKIFSTDTYFILDDSQNIAKTLKSAIKPFVSLTLSPNNSNCSGLNKISSEDIGIYDYEINEAFNFIKTNNTLSFDINTKQGAIIYISRAFSNNYKVFVNGKDFEYFRANEAFIGFCSPFDGNVKVKLVYEPRLFKLSIYSTVLGFVFLTILLLKIFRIKMEKY